MMAKRIKVWLNNELNECLRYTDVITFYHIFVTELVFSFFVFRYQIHFEFPRMVSEVPVQKFWKGKGGAGHQRPPGTESPVGWWGCKSKSRPGRWIFSGTTQCAPLLLCGSCAHWLVQRVDASKSKLLHVPTHGQIWWHPHRDTVRDQTSWTFTSNV